MKYFCIKCHVLVKTNKHNLELKAGDPGQNFDTTTGKLPDFGELNFCFSVK